MKEFEDNLGMFIDDEEWEREMGRQVWLSQVGMLYLIINKNK